MAAGGAGEVGRATAGRAERAARGEPDGEGGGKGKGARLRERSGRSAAQRGAARSDSRLAVREPRRPDRTIRTPRREVTRAARRGSAARRRDGRAKSDAHLAGGGDGRDERVAGRVVDALEVDVEAALLAESADVEVLRAGRAADRGRRASIGSRIARTPRRSLAGDCPAIGAAGPDRTPCAAGRAARSARTTPSEVVDDTLITLLYWKTPSRPP